jgi:lysophospholipase L1-like esterase
MEEGAMRLVDLPGGRTAATVLLVLTVSLAVLLASPSGSGATESYYLALGDSIAYGFQPTKARAGARPADFDTGFVDVLARNLQQRAPGLQLVNYGCPGESTVTFARGGCPAFTDRIRLHDAFRGSQLSAALAFLRAHRGAVSPITLTLFGNDWLPLLLDTCQGKIACVRKRGPAAIAAFGTRLTSIIRQLRTAAPNAEIVVTGAWNPDPSHLEPLKPIYAALEEAIVRAARPAHARVARMVPVFNPPARAGAQLCTFTFICSKGDPHPTDVGYRAMADAVLRAMR